MRFLFLCLLMGVALGLPGCDSNDEDSLDGDAIVLGLILNSQTGLPLADADVTISRGDASRSTTTDAEGEFRFENIATGTFTLRVRADGFIDIVIEDFVIEDGTNQVPPMVVAEAPPEGAYRIILTWGEQPHDLDSHLTGPDGEGGRFHVYYANMTFGDVASLDVDDRVSYGPETITLTPETSGTYRYSIHNYSNQSEAGSQGIAGEISGSQRAIVRVYDADELLREFLAPVPSQPGDTWRVFEMNASGTITPINTYVDAAGSGDMDTFRPGPGASKIPVPADGF